MLVVVLDVLAEDGFEVASSKDEHAVEALAPDGANDESYVDAHPAVDLQSSSRARRSWHRGGPGRRVLSLVGESTYGGDGVGVTTAWQDWEMSGCPRTQSRIHVGFPGVYTGVKRAYEPTVVTSLPGRTTARRSDGAVLVQEPPPLVHLVLRALLRMHNAVTSVFALGVVSKIRVSRSFFSGPHHSCVRMRMQGVRGETWPVSRGSAATGTSMPSSEAVLRVHS
ncbi:MAG: hypothetical protein ACYDEY_11095 [Acidimicrobiales bacterium]